MLAPSCSSTSSQELTTILTFDTREYFTMFTMESLLLSFMCVRVIHVVCSSSLFISIAVWYSAVRILTYPPMNGHLNVSGQMNSVAINILAPVF